MKQIVQLSIIGFFILSSSCKTTTPKNSNPQPAVIHATSDIFYSKPIKMMCSIEVSEKKVTSSENETCSFNGTILDENRKPLSNLSVFIDSVEIGTKTNARGNYSFDGITPGNHVFQFKGLRADFCLLSVVFNPGDHIELEAILYIHRPIEAAKPIIYLYPEDTIDVQLDFAYEGEITTTYPKLTSEGWEVKAFPDGTLIDNNKKEYYALYWEGEPEKPLQITDGFLVKRDETIPFLEEKLALLGLNAKESNEFIIFWLPILEKNTFNVIHFAGDDYLKQAQLSITPTPETEIRIHMVFQGLDEEVEIPLQDISPMRTIRKGFTLVEWGGQELPKNYAMRT